VRFGAAGLVVAMGARRAAALLTSTGFDSTARGVAFGTARFIVAMGARISAILSGSTSLDSPATGAADVVVGASRSGAPIGCKATPTGSGVAGPMRYAA